MLRVRSFVDPISFVRFLHIDGRRVTPELLDQFLKLPDDQFRPFFYDRRYDFVSINTELHETIHYWQGMFYPYMYWYAFMSMRAVAQIFEKCCLLPETLHSGRAKSRL
jgi:hypothetical protein